MQNVGSAMARTVTTFLGDQECKDFIQKSLTCLDNGWPQQPAGTKVPPLCLPGRALGNAQEVEIILASDATAISFFNVRADRPDATDKLPCHCSPRSSRTSASQPSQANSYKYNALG